MTKVKDRSVTAFKDENRERFYDGMDDKAMENVMYVCEGLDKLH